MMEGSYMGISVSFGIWHGNGFSCGSFGLITWMTTQLSALEFVMNFVERYTYTSQSLNLFKLSLTECHLYILCEWWMFILSHTWQMYRKKNCVSWRWMSRVDPLLWLSRFLASITVELLLQTPKQIFFFQAKNACGLCVATGSRP